MLELLAAEILHVISALILAGIAAGLWFRHRRSVHPKIMAAAFTADVLLLLYIEFTLQAVEKVVGVEKVADDVGIILWIHAAISITVIVLYVVMIVLGRKLLRGDESVRSVHRRLGITFCVLRSANFVTSFMV